MSLESLGLNDYEDLSDLSSRKDSEEDDFPELLEAEQSRLSGSRSLKRGRNNRKILSDDVMKKNQYSSLDDIEASRSSFQGLPSDLDAEIGVRERNHSSFGGSFASAQSLARRQEREGAIREKYRRLLYGTNRYKSSPFSSRAITKIGNFHSGFLKKLRKILNGWQFNFFILTCIVLNTIILAWFNPVSQFYDIPNGANELNKVSETVFLSIFVVEALLKIWVYGFFRPRESAYFMSGWNILDFSLVALGVFNAFSSSNTNLSALRTFRLLRTFKGMKSMFKSLSMMTKALLQSMGQLFYAGILLGVYFVVFGLAGVTLFGGSFTQFCVEDNDITAGSSFFLSESSFSKINTSLIDYSRLCSQYPERFGRACPEGYTCFQLPDDQQQSPIVSFHSFFPAALVVFQIITFEGWTDLMYALFDTTPWYYAAYFFLVLLFGPFFILQLFVVIMSENYNAISDKKEYEELIEKSAFEARKIFEEIAAEGKEAREEAQRQKELRKIDLRMGKRQTEMRLILSYERGNKVISDEEYDEYKAKYSSEEYEEWRAQAMPRIEKKSREHRLQLLKNAKLFQSLDSIPTSKSTKSTTDKTEDNDGQSVIESNDPNASRTGTRVRFEPSLPIEFSFERVWNNVESQSARFQPVGLSFVSENRNSLEKEASKAAKEDKVEEKKRENEIKDVEEVPQKTEVRTDVSDLLEFEEPETEFQILDRAYETSHWTKSKAEERKQLLEDTKKLIQRAQSILLEDEVVSNSGSAAAISEASNSEDNDEIKRALKTLESFLADPKTEGSNKRLKAAKQLLSMKKFTRSIRKKSENLSVRSSRREIARGLLTDNRSVKVAYEIVTNLWFKRVVVVLICANVVLLSLIRFDQDVQRQKNIFMVNSVFTIIFTVEIVLKIYAFGGTFFFKDPLNLMDAVIVFSALVGLLANNSDNSNALSILSNLRVIRLFQLFQLPQVKPYTLSLQKLIVTMGKTLTHVCPFFLVMLLFLLLFTIAGLHLFGGRLLLQESFVTPEAWDNTSTLDNITTKVSERAPYQLSRITQANKRSFVDRSDCLLLDDNIVHCPARSNYDSFLWSFVTSFQILTLENWNEVLEIAIGGEGVLEAYAITYYVVMVFIGVFIVLQLFLAVVIDSFNSEHSDRGTLLRNAWMKEHKQVRKIKKREKVLETQKSKQSNPNIGHPEEFPVNETSEAFSDSLSAPSSFMSSTRDTSTAGDRNLERLASKLAMQRENSKINFNPDSHIAFESYSLLLLSPNNKFRRSCAIIISNKYVELVIIFCIFVSCGLLAFDEQDPVVNALNIILVFVFSAEAMLKIVAFGLVLNDGSYLRDPWNVLDFVIVLVMIISLFLPPEDTSDLIAVKLLRSFRVLRPLRVVRRFESLRIVVRTLFKAALPCFWIASLCVVVYWVFGVICIGFFGGKLHACYECENEQCLRKARVDCISLQCPLSGEVLDVSNYPTDSSGVPTYCYEYDGYADGKYESHCGPTSEQVHELCATDSWLNPTYYGTMYERVATVGTSLNFDTLPASMLVLFEVTNLEGWPQVMYHTSDIVAVGVDPKRDASSYNALFWVVFLSISKFTLLQLLVAVIVETFMLTSDKETGSAFMSPAQARWVEARTRAMRSKPKNARAIKSMTFYKIAHKKSFDNFVTLIVVLNTVTLIFFLQKETTFYKVLDVFYASVYSGEAFIKLRAFGVKGYFKDNRNIFDFIVVVSVILDLVLTFSGDAILSEDRAGVGSSIFNVIEILRVLRVLRLLHKINGVSDIMDTLTTAIPSIVNILFVLFLALFMFTILGMELFQDVYPVENTTSNAPVPQFLMLNEFVNFNSFGRSMVTLFKMATGEQWNGIMRDLEQVSPHAIWFCIIYMMVVNFALLNLFTAVVLSSFMLNYNMLKNDREVQSNIKQFSLIWTRRAQLWSRKMRRKIRQDMGLKRIRRGSFSSALSNSSSFSRSTLGSYFMDKRTCMGPSSIRKYRELRKKLKIVDKLVGKMRNDKYLPYTEFPAIIRDLSPPLGIKGLGIENNLTEAETIRLVNKVHIPVTKTGLINYQQTLYALVDHALGSERIPAEVQQLLEYRMPERMLSQYNELKEQNADHSLNELYAASRLQVVLRNFITMRKMKKLQKDGYSAKEIQKMMAESKSKTMAATVFANWLRPT